MTLPANWNTVTVTATLLRADTGGPAAGSVLFEPQRGIGMDSTIVLPNPISAALNGSGSISAALPCPNDVGAGYTSLVYKVTERVPYGRTYYVQLDNTMTAEDLGDLDPLTDDQAAYYSFRGPPGPEGDVTPEALAAQAAAEDAADAAAASAAAADGSADAAAASASAAAGSAAAASASLATGGIYADIAAGLAATASGGYFSVPSAESAEYLILYKDNAGVAQEVKRYPSAGGVAALQVRMDAAEPKIDALTEAMGGYRFVNGELRMTAVALSTNPAQLGWYEIQPAYLYQDRAGTQPVTATGQNVAIILPTNAQPGPEFVANGSFANATGWNVGAGWVIGGGVATATAANGVLNYPAPLAYGRCYVVELDVVASGGTLQVDVGAGFSNIPITTTGHHTVRVICGSAPAGGLYLRAVGFTGTVDNVSMREESPWVLRAPSDGERGTYEVDANGFGLVRCLSGKRMRTSPSHAQGSSAYICAALSRTVPTSDVLLSIGAGSRSMTFQGNSNNAQLIVGTARDGAFAQPSTAPAAVSYGAPTVVDLHLIPGFTSVWVNGASRDIPDDPSVAAGELRAVPNTWVAGDVVANATFGLNHHGPSYTNGSVDFYGGCCYLQRPSEPQRRAINRHFMSVCGLSRLPESDYDIFVIAGQSNAMGVGNRTTSITPTFGTAIEYQGSGMLKPLMDPTEHAWPGNYAMTGSAWPSFAKTYHDLTGRKVAIVGAAYSGEGLLYGTAKGGWLGPNLIPILARKLSTAMVDVKGIVRGVLYIGGENDSTISFTVASYKASLVTFRDKLRFATGIPNLPLLILSLDNTASGGAQYAMMRQAQAEAAAENEGIELVLPFQDYVVGQGLSSDGIHWNQTALNDAGQKAATNCAALFPR